MKTNENIIKEKITAIEKRVTELKFIERDIMKEREVIRYPLLEKAERSPRAEELINSFFIKTMKIRRGDITVTSHPSGYSGRGGEEFLSEVKIEMQYRPDSPGDYNELSLTVYLIDGFHDETVRLKESDVMNRLMDIKSEVEKLREEKRVLRNTMD